MSTYIMSEISNVDDIDMEVWNRCIESSWSSLEEAFPWSRGDFADDDAKKDFLLSRARGFVDHPQQFLALYYKDSLPTFYMGGNVDRDQGTVDIMFVIYGPDENNSRRYLVRDPLPMKHAMRKWMRDNGLKDMTIKYCNNDNTTAMQNYLDSYYTGHSIDTGEREQKWEDEEQTLNTRINKYRLSDNVADDALD